MMKLPFKVSLLSGMAFCLSFACQAFAERGGLVVSEKTYEFGSVPQGARVVHEFVLQNKGSADVQLQKFTPSCGCTAASVDTSLIKPGESGKVRVEFDTAGFSGSKVKTVEVLTSDPDAPEITLTLRGTVVPGVSAEPRRIEFGELSSGKDPNNWAKEFTIALTKGTELKIEKVSSYSKFLAVTQVGGAEGSQVYKVELSKDAPRGEFRDRVVVQFQGDKQSSFNIPVTASLRGDLRVVPSTVSFGVIEGSEAIERRVRWENSSKDKVVVREVVSSHPAVTASFIEIQPGSKGVIVIKVDPSKVASDLRGTVEVKSDHPTEGSLMVNVFAVSPPK